LIRPGRVDLKLALEHANEEQIQALFRNFYPEASEQMAATFASEIARANLSMAHIQGHFLMHKNNPEGAIADAPMLARHSRASL